MGNNHEHNLRVALRDCFITLLNLGIKTIIRCALNGDAVDSSQCHPMAGGNFAGPGFLLPSRNHVLFRWCLTNGLRVVQGPSVVLKPQVNKLS
jgi:hypothetical protein